MSCSNFQLKVESDDELDLRAGLEIAFRSWKSATYYLFDITPKGVNRLTFYWSDPGGQAQRLPFDMDATEANYFTLAWLRKTKIMHPAPDIDGHSESCGFILDTCSDNSYSIVSVYKEWAEYHK